MDRSSRQGLRSERISNSPYKRPEASGLKKSSSTTFSTVKNIFSYALSPLFRSSSSADLTLPTTNSDIKEIDQKSESGSEDGWNGSPPALDNGKEGINGSMDVFDLAAAAGRHGKEFEDRAAKWRAKGEVVGGRRDLARRSLTVSHTLLGFKLILRVSHLLQAAHRPHRHLMTLLLSNRMDSAHSPLPKSALTLPLYLRPYARRMAAPSSPLLRSFHPHLPLAMPTLHRPLPWPHSSRPKRDQP